MIGAAELASALGLPAPTGEQVAVIEAPLGPALVVAGAGSGKTETMASRVVYLVANGKVRPDQVLGLTFTKKAAAGLAARIRRRLRTLAASGAVPGLEIDGEPEVWTYHAFGGRVIREFGPLLGVEPTARVLTPTAAWQLARRVVARWDGDLDTDLRPDQVTEHLLAISGGLADHLQEPAAMTAVIDDLVARIRAAQPGPSQRGPLRRDLTDHLKRLSDRSRIVPLVAAFRSAKRAAGVLDFADQMQLAAALLDRAPRISADLRERHRVVLLDEYQDTGHAQRVILRSLFGRREPGAGDGGHPVTAVGDPVQSIYSWRGACAANLQQFPADFPQRSGDPAAVLSLSTSFRNARAVLTVANAISGPIRSSTAIGGPEGQVRDLQHRPDAPPGTVRVGLFPTVVDENSWLAAAIADRWAVAGQRGDPPPSTAVLVRRRRDMEDLAAALRAAGLPVEVVGLGGLLAEPEIADLVATLRLLVDPTAGDAAIRLLTGARWRLGLADLDALYRRAVELAAPGDAQRGDAPEGPPADPELRRVRQALAAVAVIDGTEAASLVDAIADLGPADRYSPGAWRRLQMFGDELRRLRARLGQPLPELIADIERSTLLDVETAVHGPAGRAQLDAFGDVVADFAGTGAGPAELVEYLLAAQEREDGLAPGEVESRTDRVQVLTVHAAKGLEWQLVAVPHLSAGVFPSTQSRTWLSDSTQLPPSLRGDRSELPELTLPTEPDQKDLAAGLAAHVGEWKEAAAREERRLLYVAVTRAEHTLLVSGHHWGRTSGRPHGPSDFLTEITGLLSDAPEPPGGGSRPLGRAGWADPPAVGEQNPLTAVPDRAQWPVDPLGDRRSAMAGGAARVLAALADLQAGAPADSAATSGPPTEIETDPQGWVQDVDVLLSERSRSTTSTIDVPLPGRLSVTTLVELVENPQQLARKLRRPLPAPVNPATRRGTAFHAWLESRFHGEALLDVADLPGFSDPQEAGSDPDLDRLKQSFLHSEWADRSPVQVELPFSTSIAGVDVRGRIDAIFADPGGGFTVVDWKTGPLPPAERLSGLATQLAVYRLAAAELLQVPVGRIRAAFVFVAVGQIVAPVDLLDSAGLAALVGVAAAPPDHGEGGRLGEAVGGALPVMAPSSA